MVFVKAQEGMHGVFLSRACIKGTVVRKFSDNEVVDEPTRTSIQVAEGIHVEDIIGRYVNHACRPSCEVRDANIVALKNLSEGEEITFNYNENEDIMASPFKCRCCGEWVVGKAGANNT
jgi:hypothetical protein